MRKLLMVVALVTHVACMADGSPGLAGKDAAGNVITVSETDNGRSIQVARNAHVQVVLHSTYWKLKGSSDNSILVAEGSPQYQAKRNECLPGVGCGTITQSFVAATNGQVTLTAERNVCGEAMACAPDQQHFKVTIIVQQ